MGIKERAVNDVFKFRRADLAAICRIKWWRTTKVQLATLFKNDDVFPLIDEPTNHLDGESRKQVADYLKHKKQGFIVVSHDVAFLNQIIDHVLSIERNTILQFHGNYDTYKVEKENQDQNYLEEN